MKVVKGAYSPMADQKIRIIMKNSKLRLVLEENLFSPNGVALTSFVALLLPNEIKKRYFHKAGKGKK